MSDWIDVRTILMFVVIFVPLERLLPQRPNQRIFRKHWLNDVVYLIVNSILIRTGLLLVIAAAIVAIQIAVPQSIGLLVRQQPLWVQAIEAIVIADVGFYLAHRAFHAVPFLWKFHAIHHSIKELDWLAAHRVHPVDQILTSALSYLPLFALGFSAPAIIIQVITYQWQSHLIHSNTRLGFGPLRWIFASPQFHHWHHANERAAYDTNFSAQLTLMDALAGTLRMPKTMPTKYGVDDPVPNLYHQQLVYPLMPAKKEARISGEPEKAP